MNDHSAGSEQVAEAPPYDAMPEDAGEADEILEDAREDALDFLEGLLDAMEADGEIAAEIGDDGAIAVSIEGGDVGLLIGSRGQTLEAMQELLRTVVQRQAQARVRVTLDVDGYRERRRQAVLRQAEEMAQVAVERGEAELDPMTSYERKLVHQVVAEIEGLSSFSEGQEPRRRVKIRRDN